MVAGWDAAEVATLGRDLHERLSTLGGHLDKLGRALGGAVEAYNRSVGSLEGRVLVQARRFTDLGVTDATLDTPRQVDSSPRALSAPEFAALGEESAPLPTPAWDDLARQGGSSPTISPGVATDDFSARLGEIEAPVEIVWGARDLFCSADDQAEMLRRLPNARLLTYADAGHAVHWEEPRRFAADLARFVHHLAATAAIA